MVNIVQTYTSKFDCDELDSWMYQNKDLIYFAVIILAAVCVLHYNQSGPLYTC